MALSRQDKAYYEEKLGWKPLAQLFVVTGFCGMILWPMATFMQDSSAGQTSKWTVSVAVGLGEIGFMFGLLVSTVLMLIFRFLLSMGWLPKRS